MQHLGFRQGLMAAVATLTLSAALPAAHAATVTFTFGCSLDLAATPDACTTTGSFGTLSITDSTTNPGNAVDVSWSLSPGNPAHTTLNRILLNYQSATTPGGLTFSLANSVAAYGANGWPFGFAEYTAMDMVIGFGAPNQPLTGSETLTATSGGLSAMNFISQSPGGNPALYAWYEMISGSIHGASSYTATQTVPTPASLPLVGFGLLALGLGRRRTRLT